MPTTERVRLDKWLWAVRLYKTRSQAAKACESGHVKIAGQRVKPARDARVGEVITALVAHAHRTVRVVALLEQRVGAKLVSQFMEDQTPAEEFARAREAAAQARPVSPPGFGRPTKKQRREIERMTHLDPPESD